MGFPQVPKKCSVCNKDFETDHEGKLIVVVIKNADGSYRHKDGACPTP